MPRKYRKPRKSTKKPVTIRTVKRLIGNKIEDKYKDVQTTAAGLGLSQTPTLVHLTPIGQGDGASTRDGDEINLKSISLRYHLRTDDTLTNGSNNLSCSNVVRIMLVQWKEQSLPTAAQILEDTDAIQNLQTHYNWENRRNYKVLYDRRHNLVPSMALGTAGSSEIVPARANGQTLIFGKKLVKKLTYDGSATAGEKNSIYLMMIANTTTGAPEIFYESRILFSP